MLGHVKAWFQMFMGVSDADTLHVHMDYSPITASLGPIYRLIGQLQSLEVSKHNLPVELSANQIVLLMNHLTEFCNPMKSLSEMEDTSFMDKWWMKEVRELCYDTQDYLEVVIMQYGAGAARTWIPVPFRRIAYWIHSKLRWRPQLSHFLARAKVLKGRCPSFLSKEKSDDTSLRKELKDLKKKNLGDIETLTAQLVEMLAFDDKHTQLKVVPINGFEGSGKTLLARTLYAKYKKSFQCRAFVRVSRNPDIRSILTNILSQIKATPASPTPEVQDLIVRISSHLKHKRYFIIIDDIRRTSVWDIISRALPDDHCGSRIIITTESEHVASACSAYDLGSSTFKMDALNGCTDTITSEEKNEDINLRYNNLPLHLKTCLLYLSMYPEGWTIMKNGVIKQWVAEGFIAALERQDTEEISEIPQNKTEKMAEVAQDKRDDTSEILQDKGEEVAQVPQDQRENISEILQDQAEEIVQVNQDQKEEIARVYFDELVTRGMIQPVDINHKGELLSCTVHHMVLDLIWNKSKEDNFIVVVDNLESTLGHPDIVRRLSVQFGCEKAASIPESIILSQVRSLAFYGFLECVPSIADYALLRVLILNIWADEDMIFYLTGISELYHLTYLKIECNITVRLPSKIQRLKQLGTLELHAELVAIPSDIGHLKKLMHVCCPSNADVRELGNLTSLLDLQLNCTTIENLEEHMKLLRSTLEKLRSLRSLALVPASGSCNVNNLPANSSRMCMSCDSLCILAHVPAYLQRLELSCCCCIFSRPPKWVGELHQLCILKIAVRELYREDIDILKGLPALTTLSLHVQPMFAERIVFGKEGFSVLKYFKFTCTPWLIFKAGAMPNLQKLKLCFNSPIVDEQGTTRTIIIERLLGLKEISAIIGSAGVDIGSAWRKAIRNDPRNPKVQLVDSIYYGDQGRGMVTRDSGEDDNNEADLRIHMQPESSGLPITVRCKEEEPEDRTFISEIISILNESECSDEHAGQIFTESCRELIRRIQEDTSKQFKDEFAKELENMELTDDVVNYGDYKVEACVEQFTNLCEELKVFDLEYFYSSCGELQKQLTEHIVFHILTLEEERARKALEEQQVKSDQYIEELTRKLEQNKSIKEEMEGRVRILEPEKSNREKDAEQREKEEFEHLLQRFRTNQLERGRFKTLKLMPPSVGLVLLRRLRSFVSAFSPTSSVVHLGKPLDSSIICGGTEEAGTSSRRRTRSPLAPLAVAPSDPTTPPKQEKDEEAENTMSFDDVNALVLAERQRPQQTQEEVARSEVDARAEEFIPGFQEDLRQQRLHLQLHPDAQAPPR